MYSNVRGESAKQRKTAIGILAAEIIQSFREQRKQINAKSAIETNSRSDGGNNRADCSYF